jgi:putative ABC transport system permease protein
MGAASVLGGLADLVLVVPWLQIGAIVAVATLAGLLASVLPARRAARTSPVAAIAG